jgi:hypothetical protein
VANQQNVRNDSHALGYMIGCYAIVQAAHDPDDTLALQAAGQHTTCYNRTWKCAGCSAVQT